MAIGKARYKACAAYGVTLYETDNLQTMGDAVFAHLETGGRPRLAYVVDRQDGVFYTYELKDDGIRALEGTQHPNFREAIATYKLQKAKQNGR